MRSRKNLRLRRLVTFAMFAAMMFASRQIMAVLPNIHLIGMFVVLLTVVYRLEALIPIYIFVLIEGIFAGFAVWWLPYLYIWTVLWGVVMLLPRRMPTAVCAVVYPVVCSLHGLAYGTLYAPAQALLFGYNLKQTLAWIAAGFGYDLLHAAGNLVVGMLILPLSGLLKKLENKL